MNEIEGPAPILQEGVRNEIQGALASARTQLTEAVATTRARLEATTAAIGDLAGRLTPGVDEEEAISSAKATVDATTTSVADAGDAAAAVLDSLAQDLDRLGGTGNAG